MKCCGYACLSLIGISAVAQADGFAFFRYDDDFTYLSDPSKRVSWYDEIKYIPLGDDASQYLSIGGDLRERVESYSDGYFGPADAPHTTARIPPNKAHVPASPGANDGTVSHRPVQPHMVEFATSNAVGKAHGRE
jgi:hypothetical protein